MTRHTLLIILGMFVAIAPQSGLPLSILEVVLLLIGFGIVGIGVVGRIERRRARAALATPRTFEDRSSAPRHESPEG